MFADSNAGLVITDAQTGSENDKAKLLQGSVQPSEVMFAPSASLSPNYVQAPPSSDTAGTLYPGAAPDVIRHTKFEFSSGICDCCGGPAGFQTCLMSFFIPCLAHGIIVDAASGGRGQTAPCLFYIGAHMILMACRIPIAPCILGSFARRKMRSKYGITGERWQDTVLHFFCHPCSMGQELRELHALRARSGAPEDALARSVGTTLPGAPDAAEAQEAIGEEGALFNRRPFDWARSLAASYH